MLNESDDESELDTHIKVPPPPPVTDRSTRVSVQAHLIPTKVLSILLNSKVPSLKQNNKLGKSLVVSVGWVNG